MNTDNMSILGLTIDYGPYGWLEPYDPDWTPNTTDFGSRRYAFGQQPRVAMWNLMALAQALGPLVADAQELRAGLDVYADTFAATQHALLLRKLGLTALDEASDRALTEALPTALAEAEVDMTIFFRQLSYLPAALLAADAQEEALFGELLAQASYTTAPGADLNMREWLHRYTLRLRQESASPEVIQETMLGANPKYVLRNYLAQLAIEAAEAGDLSKLDTLFEVLKTPFAEHPAHEELAAKRPEWAQDKPGSATLSCSS
jgi:uncharacterized protein YdiU (UPF0061 family)